MLPELSILRESDLDALFPGAREQGFTYKEMRGALGIIDAVAEAIMSLGSVPSGHLYAMLAGQMNLATYGGIIAKLKRAGLITERNHLLTWVGR